MADAALCDVCLTEQKLTPKAGNVVKHAAPRHSALYAAVPCKGSGKTPRLYRRATCDECGQEVKAMINGILSKHYVGGEQCVSSLKEAAHHLIEELGAVEVTATGEGTSSTPAPSAPETSPSNSSGRPSAAVAERLIDVPPLPSPAPAKPANSTGGSEVPLPTPTSTSASGAISTPPSSDAMFGEAGATVRAKPRKRVPLEGEALALSNWFDDLFFRYQHSRERSMQPTIGPSEIGSKCMRKIAMKLSQRPDVNFEKDSYAAWFGTQGHLGLEEMLRWANETMHVERFLIEAALKFGSTALPHGHSDAFDRRPDAVGFDRLQGVVIDWKFPGASALSKMFLDGCPDEYQDQGHLYGYGQRLAGENVERVAVIALPREGGDLSKKFVWVAPYDEERAISKIKKAEAIKERLDHYAAQGNAEPWKMAPKTPSYLCPYCPFYLANDKAEERGCSA